MNTSKAIEDLKLKYFFQQQPIFDLIRKHGNFSEYFYSLPLHSFAFKPTNKFAIVCIDEGLQSTSQISDMTPIGIAGSGIMLSAKSQSEFRNKIRDLIGTSNKVVMTSHLGGCCAASHATKNCKNNMYSDIFGRNFVNSFTKILGIDHIEISKLNRPDFHIARMAFITDTPSNISRVKGVPPMFYIDSTFINIDDVLDEIELALSFAFGEEGFGDLFTRENPFYVILMIKDKENREYFSNRIKYLREKYSNRVVIEEFNNN